MKTLNPWEVYTVFSEFGNNIKVRIFGGSHEPEIGVAITGLPCGTAIDLEDLQKFLDLRAPGNSPFATSRKEPDRANPGRESRSQTVVQLLPLEIPLPL